MTDQAMGGRREILVLALAATGWLYMIAHLLSTAPPGTLTLAGPGMRLLEVFHRDFSGESFLLELYASLCVTGGVFWTGADFLRAFGMWAAMALAMMLPTLLWSRPPREGAEFLRFLGGYAVAWTPFCVLAVLCQWLLRRQDLLNEHMVSTSWTLNLFIFALIGASYLKREPLRRIARRVASPPWPEAAARTRGFFYGLAASWACVPLMALMFVLGLMNLVAMAALTAVMAAQAAWIKEETTCC